MRVYEWMPGRLRHTLLLLLLLLIGNSVALAQAGEGALYPIANVVATSTAPTEDDAGPENTVNGSGLNAGGQHSTRATDMWVCVSDGESVYIQFQFDAVYELQEMHVWNYNVLFESLLGFGAKDVTIEYSENGSGWTVLSDVEIAQASGQPDYVANTIVPLEGILARYVRLVIHRGWGRLGQVGLSEVRFFGGAGQTPPADTLIIDDFESYTVNNLIFNSWSDSWANHTGATVGYLVEPFTEQEIVHGGLQSMPLFYNNARSPYYSEASHELPEQLRDWNASGAGALTLYFHGNTEQTQTIASDKLYVVVEDDRGGSAEVHHPDPEALQRAGWQEWTIGFEELGGVDLSHVDRLIVGIGDRNNPRAGGISVVYVDDIGLSNGGGTPPTDSAGPIANVVATSNAISEEDEGPENTVNGSGLNDDYEHSTRALDMWLGEQDAASVYIQFAFDHTYKLDEMWVWNYSTIFEAILGFGVKDVTIEYSGNGFNWTTWGDVQFAQGPGTENYAANTIVELGGITARYVRLNILSGWGVIDRYGLSEVKFFSSQPQVPSSFVLLLDDFEGYDADERIYNVWLDSWVNETGSRVGYLEEPFTEQQIVNGGSQSMPLFYDNVASPFYSEAYRELAPELQDWSASGAEALTLHFHGSADHDHNVDTDWLYVAVEDDRGHEAVVYHRHPQTLLRSVWQEWTIALDEFDGVDLSHVTRLILGVGKRDNPQRGANSVVYFDDIGLTAGRTR